MRLTCRTGAGESLSTFITVECARKWTIAYHADAAAKAAGTVVEGRPALERVRAADPRSFVGPGGRLMGRFPGVCTVEEQSTPTSESALDDVSQELAAHAARRSRRMLALQLLVGPIGMATWTTLEATKTFPSRSASVLGIWSAMLAPIAVAVVLVLMSKSRRRPAVLWGVGSVVTTFLGVVASVLLLICAFGMAR